MNGKINEAKNLAAKVAERFNASYFHAIDMECNEECFAVKTDNVIIAIYINEPDCIVSVGDKDNRFVSKEN